MVLGGTANRCAGKPADHGPKGSAEEPARERTHCCSGRSSPLSGSDTLKRERKRESECRDPECAHCRSH